MRDIQPDQTVWISEYAAMNGSIKSRIFSVRISIIYVDGYIEINNGDGPPGTRRHYGPNQYHETRELAIEAAERMLTAKVEELDTERNRLLGLREEYRELIEEPTTDA